MAIRIEFKNQINEIKGEQIPRRILFFIPPELWMGDAEEEHRLVLEQSGRPIEEVAVAGFISYYEELSIDGRGSQYLGIKRKDPTPVIKFVESLPE